MNPGPGKKNLITDILGIQVGHAEDIKIGTGVTVITGNKPFSAAVDVRGGGPGTRETDMLSLENSIGRADAIVLSGGSAFGLDACSEVQDLLRKDNKGYKVGKAVVPLVPGAVIFDLNLNDKPHINIIGERSPWRTLANKAYKSANTEFLLGSFGAGCGATTATLKGGQGSTSWTQTFSNGKVYTVGAIVINNAVGNPLLNEGPNFLSAHLEFGDEFGGYGISKAMYDNILRAKRLSSQSDFSENFDIISSNTVIGVIATDAPLTRSNLKRLAIMAHDGIARSLTPAHTPMDGDTIFSITTCQNIKEQVLDNLDILALGSRASDCFARACNRAVYEAEAVGNSKLGWKNFFQYR